MLMTYSAPLTMVIESISRLTEFLETITVYPLDNGVGAFAKHRNRSWDLRHSSLFLPRGGGVASTPAAKSPVAPDMVRRCKPANRTQ